MEIFRPPVEKFVRHSLKNLGPYQKTLRRFWCPKLVMGLGMAPSAACERGTEKQTVVHVVLQCPIHRPLHGLHSLTIFDDDKIEWLLNTCLEI